MAPGLSKGLRKSLLSQHLQITPFSNEPTVSKSGVPRWTKRDHSTVSAPQPQIIAPSNEPTLPKSSGNSTNGVSRWKKRDHSTVSVPQPQITASSNSIRTSANGASCETDNVPFTNTDAPFTNTAQHQTNPLSDESMVPNSIRTSYKGTARGKKRGPSNISVLQSPEINPTSHETTRLTSVGTSVNGVQRSNRRVFADSAPQSEMNMSFEPTIPISNGTSTDDAPKPFKKVRGKTRCLASERALQAARRKLPVIIKAEDGKPSGANSRFFVNEIGFVIRTFAPLQYECWGDIPDQEKESLFFRLLTKYDADTSKPYVMTFIYTTMSKRYTEFRNKLKGYFLKFANVEEARKHKPDDVEKQEDWNYICDLFTTNEKYKNRSAKNTINRSKLQYNHRGGSISFVNYQYEVLSEDEDEFEDDDEWMENALPKRPRGPIEVFHKTHYNDTKGWTSELAETHYNEMIALQKEQEGSDEAKRLSEKEICAIVLGKRSACVFSFKSKTRAEELEAENEQLKLELQEMKASMAGVKDMQKMISQLQDFQKRIEGDSSSAPTDACMD